MYGRSRNPHLAMTIAKTPSAPPPYEARHGTFSFLPERVRRKLRMSFPVFESLENTDRAYAPVEYGRIKELAEAVKKYGVSANFTLAQLDQLTGDAMTHTY